MDWSYILLTTAGVMPWLKDEGNKDYCNYLLHHSEPACDGTRVIEKYDHWIHQSWTSSVKFQTAHLFCCAVVLEH